MIQRNVWLGLVASIGLALGVAACGDDGGGAGKASGDVVGTAAAASAAPAPVQPERTVPPFNVPMATLPEPGAPQREFTPEDGFIRVWTADNTEVLGYILLSE